MSQRIEKTWETIVQPRQVTPPQPTQTPTPQRKSPLRTVLEIVKTKEFMIGFATGLAVGTAVILAVQR